MEQRWTGARRRDAHSPLEVRHELGLAETCEVEGLMPRLLELLPQQVAVPGAAQPHLQRAVLARLLVELAHRLKGPTRRVNQIS